MKSPKELFLENDTQAAAWRSVAKSNLTEAAITTALAQVAIQMPTQENLVGIRRFIDVLTTLGDKEEAATQQFMPRLTPPESLVPEPKKKA